MALQNIGASNRDDAFYRYKMPKMVTKIEGRGNGIKTNLVNMVEVSKALARPPSYTTKYFGCELGAQSKYDEKTGTCIVNGAHDQAKLAALLENFIKKYVQCYGCGNPETEVVVTKSQVITLNCAACGFVSDVDMRDKLTTFILKNPPEQKKGGKAKKSLRRAEKERLKEGEAVDEEMKKLKKEPRKKKGPEEKTTKKKASGSDEDEQSPNASQAGDDEASIIADDVQWHTDTSVEAAQQRIKEQLTSATSEMVILDNGAHDPEVPAGKGIKDNKTKAVPKKALVDKVNSGEDLVKETDLKKMESLSLHEKLVKEFKEHIKDGSTAVQLASYLHSKAGPEQEAMNAYFEALFGGVSKGLAKEVAKKKTYLANATKDENSQRLLLGAIDKYCSILTSDAGSEVALLLKTLYDGDILEEDQILFWYDEGTVDSKVAKVRKDAEPFVEWLRTADSESEG
eukprot:c28888_g2_i1 orf=320-1687(-)